ncbi:laminin subunit beta-1-like isoform X2 [Clavelina lepadiformis]|uniref:laminin subunit beta-1-like isoform X2 n=1 Tax=Clavelina lepadiformis TaxID=159417 RepID=UPI0040417EDF
MRLLLGIAVSLLVVELANGQRCEGTSCFPSTGDLLIGRGHMLSATSTCGESGPEPFCIVSHLKDVQKCFTCDAADPARSHEVQNVITTFNDRLETWWQSESGRQLVSIELDLEAEFQFTHLIMTFKTFRPAGMYVERSMDFGKTWQIYRYFAYNCDKSFPDVPEYPPREIDDVVCDSRYSQIEPSNGGEVIFRVLEPSITIDDPYAPRIQNLLKITNLRIVFTELHTLGDDLLDARKDIKNKYYYALYELIVRGNCFCYGHADECTPINADQVNSDNVHNIMHPDDESGQRRVHGRCRCQHNTIGLNCEQCKPFYQDQPWRPAEAGMPHECQPCNCNGHATECHFDPAVFEATGRISGGVCENCQHNTVGRQCELCAPYYYQDPNKDIRDPTVCAPCECEVAGSLDGGICDGQTNADLGMIAGQCRCKRYVEGPRCDQCKAGYYNLDENNPDGCTACDCDSLGTLSGPNTCDSATGQCICKRFTTGRRCDQCVPQTWGMSSIAQGCNECDCDIGGAYDNDCDQTTGQCNCRPSIEQRRCDAVVSGNFLPGLDYYVFEAEEAEIDQGAYEDKRPHTPPVTWTGDGYMLVQEEGVIVFIVKDLPASMDYNLILRYQSNMPNAWQYVEITIDRPNQGNIPTGSPCGNTRPEDDSWMTSLPGPPTTHNSLGIICLERDYTYRVIVDLRRYQREQDPNGPTPDILIDSLLVVPVYSSMDMFQGSVAGRRRAQKFEELDCQEDEMFVPDREPHEECAGLLFSMSAILHDGSKPCDCDLQGSESRICDDWGGQCVCKPNVIGRRCDRCAPGTYGFGPSGCRACDCDAQGSRDQFCDAARGQCTCLPGVSGRRCDQCKPGYYLYPECRRCECNGHADTCDQETGSCIDCRDNTMGDHCDICDTGYYGNPALGNSDQCKPCLCPDGPDSGRQFSSGCRYDAVTRQVTCSCLPGYSGPRCDECAPAFWGNPQETNGLCRECECNGNVDTLDPDACDAATGVCTGCLYDTAGPHCERCKDFYYGSAFDKTCRVCACNLLGTDRSTCEDDQCQCNLATGQCDCLPNVAGKNCDQCEPNHWHLASGEGCEACDCNLANSIGPSCNEITGQCQCVEGFGGRTCNDCADGYFGDPYVQCFACDCDSSGSVSSQCNTRTGQCECLDGVGGRRCDRCLRGYTGDVPNCESCGECFTNWDTIITELKDRTNAAIQRAKNMGETGITGAFADQFDEIEKKLESFPPLNDPPPDNTSEVVDMIKQKLAEQEKRLDELEKDIERIRASDDAVNKNMTELDAEADKVMEKLDSLREQKQSISKVSSVAAYKQIEDAAATSAQAEHDAEAATTEPGSLVEQSKQIREEVEGDLADKKAEFDDKMSMLKGDIDARRSDIDELTVSDLNRDVCGKSTEGCDETCGGAGCDTCGGIGCPGAVQYANDAKDRSQKTQETLNRVADEASELKSRVQVAKESAEEAKTKAQVARDRAQEVEGRVREQNSKVKNLIRDIRNFLEEDNADPSSIEEVAEEVLALSLPISRSEIDALATEIADLVGRLPNVDQLLSDTQDDLERANQLLVDANQAKASATAVAGEVDEVITALEQAENASSKAETAKNKAAGDIELAEAKINQINAASGRIEDQMTNISNRLNDFTTRVMQLERRLSDNNFNLDNGLNNSKNAQAMAQMAIDNLAGQSDLVDQATNAIYDTKDKTDRLTALRENAESLQRAVQRNVNKLAEINNQFDDYDRQMADKSDRLAGLLEEVEQLFQSISEAEVFHRRC